MVGVVWTGLSMLREDQVGEGGPLEQEEEEEEEEVSEYQGDGEEGVFDEDEDEDEDQEAASTTSSHLSSGVNGAIRSSPESSWHRNRTAVLLM